MPDRDSGARGKQPAKPRSSARPDFSTDPKYAPLVKVCDVSSLSELNDKAAWDIGLDGHRQHSCCSGKVIHVARAGVEWA